MSGSPARAGERVLFRARSAVQDIVLTQRLEDDAIDLTLDGVWQFDSHDEHVFHETLVDVAMVLAPDPRRVLVLGGGDGLALRNVLRYPQVESAVLCEIDPLVIEMTRTVPAMRALSADSLIDPRVRVVVADALAWVRGAVGLFDVIICDFPAATHEGLAPLFAPELYAQLRRLAHERTIVSVQVSQDPPGFWEVLHAVESGFAWTVPLLVELTRPGSADPGWADFVIAAATPAAPCRSPAPATSFLTLADLPRLVVRNRSGPELSTGDGRWDEVTRPPSDVDGAAGSTPA